MRGLIHIGLTILMAGASLPAFAQLPREPLTVRVVATDFVLRGKIDKLKELAADSHVVLSRAALSMPDLEADPRPAHPRHASASRPFRGAACLGETLSDTRAPRIRVGGGPPAFGNLRAGGQAADRLLRQWRPAESQAPLRLSARLA